MCGNRNYRGSKIDRIADQEYLRLLKAALDQLSAYKQAEKDGYLVTLSCKPGQHVFVMRGYDQRICECVVTRIILAKGYRAAEVESVDGTEMGYGFPLLEWGRTAFATREEAERAEKPDVCFAKAHAAEAADEVLKGVCDGD